MRGIRIISPGMYSSIQDIGRFGYREFGLPCSGVMDKHSFYVANYLCGNKQNEALIESLFHGLEIEFLSSCLFAVSGAEAGIRKNKKTILLNRSYKARRGDILKILKVKTGARNYISFSGGFHIDPQLGSCSTYAPAGIGGARGRELKQSDIIPLNSSFKILSKRRNIKQEDIMDYSSPVTLNILLGIDAGLFPKESLITFLNSEFTVSHQSDRMGLRLQRTKNIDIPNEQIISYGIHPGTIQLPPDGNPIIMGADCQTTGGYPQIANILNQDLHRCGQLKPGDIVKFILSQQ